MINALKTIGKDRVLLEDIEHFRKKLTDKEKQQLLFEAVGTTAWIFEVIRQICT